MVECMLGNVWMGSCIIGANVKAMIRGRTFGSLFVLSLMNTPFIGTILPA